MSGPESRDAASRARRIAREAGWACLLFVGLAVVFFYDVVFLGKTLRASQTISTTLVQGHFNYAGGLPRYMALFDNTPAVLEEPYQQLKQRAFRAGVFPLWNPCQAAGYPFLAALESSLLFAPELLLYAIPSPYGWDVYLLLRLVLAGLSSYLLMRLLGFDVLPARVAGAAYMFSGPLVSWVANVTLNTDVLVPLFLASLELVLRSRRRRWVVCSALVVFQALVGGQPEQSFFLLATGSLYFVARLVGAGQRDSLRDVVARFVIVLACGSGLAALQLLPFLEYALLHSWHIHGGDVGLVAEPLRSAATILLPWYFSSELVSYQGWTANTWPGGWLGFLPVWLVVFAALARRKPAPGWFFLVLFGLCLLKVYGFPGINWIGALPVFDRIRFSLHIAPQIALAAAVLSGMAISELARDARSHARFLLAVALPIALTLAFAAAYPPTNDPRVVFGLPAALFIGVAVAFLVCRRAPWGPRVFAGSVAAALLVELFLLIPRERTIRDVPFQVPPYVEFLRKQPELGRVYGLGGVLSPNTATAFGLHDIGMYEGLFVDRFADYVRELVDAKFFSEGSFHAFRGNIEDPGNRFLDLLNLKYFIAPRGMRLGREQLERYSLRRVYTGEVVIFERLGVLPRAMVRHQADVVADDAQALALLKSGYDIRSRVLLDRLPSGVALDAAAPGEDASQVEVVEYAINSKSFRVDMEHAGLLVVNDVDYPGWRVEIDGERGEVLTANYLFQAVYIPAGRHSVRFEFRPASFVVGALISAAALVFLAVFALRDPARRSRGAAPAR